MAFILCEEHGGTPCIHVCPHLFDDVINRRRVDGTIRLDAKYLGDDAWCIHLCTECGSQHEYSQSTVVPGDDALDKLMAMEQSPVCQICFAGLRKSLPCQDEMDSIHDGIPTIYNRVLELAILDLRVRIRYDDGVTINEVHDLMDALHNIPQMLRDCSGWHVPENIDADLARYDEKWVGSDDSVRRKSLIQHLNDVRDGKHDNRR